MAGRIILDEFNPAIDANGEVDDGCTITFYKNRTTTLQSVYSDSNLTTPLANPMSPNAAGRFPDPAGNGSIWAPDNYTYTIKVEWSNGDIATRDDVRGSLVNGYDLAVYIEGAPADGEIFPIFMVTRPLLLPEDLSESQFAIKGVAPTATNIFTLYKNGVEIGSISFATDKTPSVSFDDDITFAPGDALSMQNQATADATMTNISFTFAFIVI